MTRKTPLMLLVALAFGGCGGSEAAVEDPLSRQLLVATGDLIAGDLPGCDAVCFAARRHEMWRHPDASDLIVVSVASRGLCVDTGVALRARLVMADPGPTGGAVFCIAGDSSCGLPGGDGPSPFGDDPIPPSNPKMRQLFDPAGDDPIPPSRPPGGIVPHVGDDPIPPSDPRVQRGPLHGAAFPHMTPGSEFRAREI